MIFLEMGLQLLVLSEKQNFIWRYFFNFAYKTPIFFLKNQFFKMYYIFLLPLWHFFWTHKENLKITIICIEVIIVAN